MVMHIHLTIAQYLFLFVASIFASVVDTIAGGGGMIALPSLLSVNIAPATALGTNRIQSAVGEIVAAFRFHRQGLIKFKELALGFVLTGVGGALGSIAIMKINSAYLLRVMPFLLLALFLFFLFSPSLRDDQVKQRLKPLTFYICIGMVIGFYNGFFGPGTGTFWVLALMFFMGLPMDRAVMQAKPFNTVGNIASLIVFAVQGHIAYWAFLVMAPGQIIGASIASQLVMKHGTRLVRPTFIIVFGLLMIKLFYNNF